MLSATELKDHKVHAKSPVRRGISPGSEFL